MSDAARDDIAIIGMAGLFPRAASAARFWDNIVDGVDAVDDAPEDWAAERFYDPDSDEIGRIYTRKGGFLGALSRFDPRRFGIMPKSLQGSEPDHYHALDLSEQALRDAGLDPRAIDGRRTGVIIGHGIHAHRANVNGVQHGIVLDQTVALLRRLAPDASDEAAWRRLRAALKAKLPEISADSAPGLVPNVMTGRIANRLDLHGPNYIIDAACASSLIAVDNAVTELRLGRADLMLAGGINTSTSPLVYAVFCALGALSRASRIRPFDAGADGTLLGEGGGMVVLKRRADAERDGDRIYALLKAVGQSSDGRGNGVMAPSREGEALAIRRAYEAAGVDPHSVSLIECHGTGIPLGDETEFGALRDIWGQRRGRAPAIALGSVKSMIGHCIPAAGIASLIKTSLALYHRILPPTLCETARTDLALTQSPFYLNTEARPWVHRRSQPRRAGINAFGFGGVNAHALLEEAPAAAEPLCTFAPARRAQGAHLLPFAAADRDALLAQLEALAAHLEHGPVDLAATAAAQITSLERPGPCRAAIVARDTDQLAKSLATLQGLVADPKRQHAQTRGGAFFGAAARDGEIAFLFPGETAQYPGMLKAQALHFPAARRWLDFLEELFAERGEFPPSAAVYPHPNGVDPASTQAMQAALADMELGSEAAFAAGQAMHALLGAFGLRAQYYLGHSTGENGALVASGLLDLDDARLGAFIARMNALFRELDAADAIPHGALYSIAGLDIADIMALVERDPDLFLTMDNCAHQVIVYGSERALAPALRAWTEQGAICAKLPLTRAYHTPLLTPMSEGFEQLFAAIGLRETETQVFSCVRAAPFPPARDAIACRRTAVAQYVEPVRFRESVLALHDQGVRIFIEVGPSSVLSAFVRDILKGREHLVVASDDRKRPGTETLLLLLARLFTAGVPLDLGSLRKLAATTDDPPPAPHLPTALPFIDLQADDLALVPAGLRGGVQVPEPSPAPAATRPAPPAEPTVPASAPGTASIDGAHRATVQHFQLMREFLAQQQRLMALWRRSRNGGDP